MLSKRPLCLAVARSLHPRRSGLRWPVLMAAALAAPLQAHAENRAPPGTDEATQLDAVRVSAPILASQAQSIELQREAVNVVSAIAADDIGQFPDQTAAAALARLPAVAVQRDQGQERFIQVRGAPARWTSVAFDGINVIGAEDRIFRFDAVPAGLIDTVAISKTLTPAMPAEALAGRVDIETVSPMAQRGFHGQADLGYGWMQLGDGNQHQGSARLAWSNDTFGILVGGSTYNREQITDNREFDYDFDTGVPTAFDLRSYTLERETNSGMLKMEWRPIAGHAFAFTSLYTEFNDHELRDQYVFDVGDAAGGSATPDRGSLVGVPYNSQLQDGDYANSTWTTTLSGRHALETWDLGWALNYTETESTVDLPLIRQMRGSTVSLDYDHSDRGYPTFDLYETVAGADGAMVRGQPLQALPQTGFGMTMIIPINADTPTESTTFKFDAARDLDIADGARLSLGLQADRRRAEGVAMAGNNVVMASILAASAGLDYDLDPYVTDRQWTSGFPRGFGVGYVDNAGIRRETERLLRQLAERGLYDPTIPASDIYQVDEDITAAFAMLEVTSGRHQLLGGVRFERAKIASEGSLAIDGVMAPASHSRSRNDVLPSLHWNMDLGPDLKLRNALVTGLARPTFGDLRVNASIQDSEGVVSGGNPDLVPERAWGYDGSLEWYFADASIASVGVFYRDVEDVLFDSTARVTDDRYDSAGVSRIGYDYVTTLNGGGGELYGAEFNVQTPLAFLPSPFDGFGVQVNLALVDGEFATPEGREVAFPGTSSQVFNASLYYEKYGFSARLAYQWRDKWLDDVSPDGTGDTWWHDTEQLDLSLRYALNPSVTLFADANNLTDEHGVRYTGSMNTPIETEGFGRRYMAGVRVRF